MTTITRRAAFGTLAAAAIVDRSWAQNAPVRIGYSISKTGPNAAAPASPRCRTTSSGSVR